MQSWYKGTLHQNEGVAACRLLTSVRRCRTQLPGTVAGYAPGWGSEEPRPEPAAVVSCVLNRELVWRVQIARNGLNLCSTVILCFFMP